MTVGGILIFIGVGILFFMWNVHKNMKKISKKWSECGKSERGHEFFIAGDICDRCGMPRKFL